MNASRWIFSGEIVNLIELLNAMASSSRYTHEGESYALNMI